MPSLTINWAGFVSQLEVASTNFQIWEEPLLAAQLATTKLINTIAKEKAKMIIPSEIKEKLVDAIPIPDDLLNYFLKRKNQPTNASHWRARAKVLWRKVLLETPILDWSDYVGIDKTSTQVKFTFRTSNAIWIDWMSGTQLTPKTLDPIIAGITLPHHLKVNRVVQGSWGYDTVVYKITAGGGVAENRMGRILSEIAIHYPQFEVHKNTNLAALDGWFRRIDDANFETLYKRARKGIDAIDTEIEKNVRRQKAEESFTTFHSNRKRTAFAPQELRASHLDTLTIPEHGLKSSRQWGIEVEAAGARRTQTPAGWDRKYDSSLESAYDDYSDTTYIDPANCEYNDHNLYIDGPDGGALIENPDYTPEYECDSCGEIYQEDGNYEDTGEFVSPILHSFHSRGLENLVKELSEEPQNDTAGIHVHVDVDDLTPKQIGGLIFGYEMIEPLIENDYQRLTRSYCKSRYPEEVLEIIRSAKVAKNKAYDRYAITQQASYIEPGDRYVSLNVCSLSSHGTVEFRAMGPVYEYEHLIRWAHFCREMVNLAKANVTQKEWSSIRSFGQLRALFAKYGAEQEGAFRDITDNVIIREESLEEV